MRSMYSVASGIECGVIESVHLPSSAPSHLAEGGEPKPAPQVNVLAIHKYPRYFPIASFYFNVCIIIHFNQVSITCRLVKREYTFGFIHAVFIDDERIILSALLSCYY